MFAAVLFHIDTKKHYFLDTFLLDYHRHQIIPSSRPIWTPKATNDLLVSQVITTRNRVLITDQTVGTMMKDLSTTVYTDDQYPDHSIQLLWGKQSKFIVDKGLSFDLYTIPDPKPKLTPPLLLIL